MSTLLQKIDTHMPFTKSERIIICIVLLLHALPALDFLHWTSQPTKSDDERVAVNLVSPEAAQKSQQAPAATPPKPKEEPKKRLRKSLHHPRLRPNSKHRPKSNLRQRVNLSHKMHQ